MLIHRLDRQYNNVPLYLETEQCDAQLTVKEEERCELGIQQSPEKTLEEEEPAQQNQNVGDDKHQQPERNHTTETKEESQSSTDQE